jgi:hypothetical protein
MSNERSVSEGFESSIIKSFSGWDGDLDCILFYNVEFSLFIGGYEPNKIHNGVSVAFLLDKSIVAIYNKDGEEVYTSKFKVLLC